MQKSFFSGLSVMYHVSNSMSLKEKCVGHNFPGKIINFEENYETI